MKLRTALFSLIAVVAGVHPAAAADPNAATSATPPGTSDTSAPLQEITVLGRLAQEARITNYVYGITTLENYEGAARWQVPVCPQVTGLPRDQGEYVLGRFSDIARSAGVRLAGERCRPNLVVFVTAQPVQLLRAMQQRYYAASFGNAPPLEVAQFIATPRPVRVWHSPYWTPGDGSPMAVGLPPAAQLLGGGLSQPPTYTSPGDLGPSRLFSPGGWAYGNTFVIVDQTQLKGVTTGQFADYLAMVSLATIKPMAHVGDAPSILTLFSGGPQSTPPKMSDWDLSFLKSLYRTYATSTMQRSQISRGMMDDLVH